MSATVDLFRQTADALEQAEKFPFGPPIQRQHEQMAGEACVRLCNEDPDKARALWRMIAEQCGGYFPQASATAIIAASNTVNIVPDVTPDTSQW